MAEIRDKEAIMNAHDLSYQALTEEVRKLKEAQEATQVQQQELIEEVKRLGDLLRDEHKKGEESRKRKLPE